MRHGWASNLDFDPLMHLLLSERSFHRKPFLVRNQSYPWAIEFWPLDVLLPYILPAYFDHSQQLQLISALGTTISRSHMWLLCELAEERMLFGLHIGQRAYGNSKHYPQKKGNSKRWMSHPNFVWLSFCPKAFSSSEQKFPFWEREWRFSSLECNDGFVMFYFYFLKRE